MKAILRIALLTLLAAFIMLPLAGCKHTHKTYVTAPGHRGPAPKRAVKPAPRHHVKPAPAPRFKKPAPAPKRAVKPAPGDRAKPAPKR